MSSDEVVVVRDPGSFRDPAGFVFHMESAVFRAVDSPFFKIWQDYLHDDAGMALQHGKLLVPTTLVAPNSEEFQRAKHAFPEFDHFLQHDVIAPINYPYEWSISMLADAAHLQIAVQLHLMNDGYGLKDATAFNIQFQGYKPVFIDVTSIEKPVRADIWVALDQLLRMFCFPLLLHRYHHMDHKAYFLAYPEGMSVSRMRKVLGRFGSWGWRTFMDVGLPNLLNDLSPGRKTKLKDQVSKKGGDPRALRMNLERLDSKMAALGKNRQASHWSAYTETHSYSEKGEARKKDIVVQYLKAWQPETVLDLGCNTGLYSKLAAAEGAQVTAVDGDHDCIDALYQEVKAARLNVLPLWVDLANPSPGIGLNNRERTPLLSRISSDVVLALALVHHLLVTCRWTLEIIRDSFHDLTHDGLLVEFVEPQDRMFQELLSLRNETFADLTLERFLAVFAARFELVEQHKLPDTQRHLLVMKKK